MDEIIITPRIRWDSKTNDVTGFCFNHKINNYKLNSYLDISELKESMITEEIHHATEALVICITHFSTDLVSKTVPILVIPICSHKLVDILEKVINHVDHVIEMNDNAFLINIATDGDKNRRNTLNKMKKKANIK